MRAPALLALGILPWASSCGGGAEPDLRVDAAFLAEPIGEGPAALYLRLRNAGGAADTLEALSSAVAERAELHRQEHEDGRVRS